MKNHQILIKRGRFSAIFHRFIIVFRPILIFLQIWQIKFQLRVFLLNSLVVNVIINELSIHNKIENNVAIFQIFNVNQFRLLKKHFLYSYHIIKKNSYVVTDL